MKIKFYNKKLEHFIESLEKPEIAKTLRILDLLEYFGKNLGMPYSKKVAEYLFELRVRGKKEIRIIYSFIGGGIILLNAFIKTTRKIPRKEIRIAKKRFKSIEKT